MRQIVENRTDDQGHDKVTEKLSEGQAGIRNEALETTPQAESDLTAVRKSIWRLDTLVLGLLGASRLLEAFKVLATNRILLVVLIEVCHQLLALN